MAEQGAVGSWPIEDIPDQDHLFMRMHRMWFKPEGTIIPGAFQKRGGGTSTDWSRYSTPQQTRRRGRTPSDNAVIGMIVGAVRAKPTQRVEHTPKPENRAHTDVLGEDDEEVRTKLVRLTELVLHLSRE